MDGLTAILEDILGDTQHYCPKKKLPKRRKNNYRPRNKVSNIPSSLRHGGLPVNIQESDTER